jgi:hypothetical protein
MSSHEYHRPTKARRGKLTQKTAPPYNRPRTDSMVELISAAQKGPIISQTQKLLLAAIRLWEVKNGYRQ